MNLVYIVLAHKNPEQVVRLVHRLNTGANTFLIHLDSQMAAADYAEIVAGLHSLGNVLYLPRLHAYWGGWPIMEITIQALQWIVTRHIPCDYALLLSGQCYPLAPNQIIQSQLEAAKGQSFLDHFALPNACWPKGGMDRIEKWHFRVGQRQFVYPEQRQFQHPLLKPVLDTAWSALITAAPLKRHFPAGLTPFGGSMWWCLARPAVDYICHFVAHNPAFVRFFRYTLSGDEIFFQSVLANSPLKEQLINQSLHYIDWSRPVRPAILGSGDLPVLLASSKLFARKFDIAVDAQVLDQLDDAIAAASPA